MSTNEMHDVIKELKEFKLLKEEAEARIAELESVIKDEMKSQELEKMVVGEYKCSLATVTSTTSVFARHWHSLTRESYIRVLSEKSGWHMQ